jgi:hypothetical protein
MTYSGMAKPALSRFILQWKDMLVQDILSGIVPDCTARTYYDWMRADILYRAVIYYKLFGVVPEIYVSGRVMSVSRLDQTRLVFIPDEFTCNYSDYESSRYLLDLHNLKGIKSVVLTRSEHELVTALYSHNLFSIYKLSNI